LIVNIVFASHTLERWRRPHPLRPAVASARSVKSAASRERQNILVRGPAPDARRPRPAEDKLLQSLCIDDVEGCDPTGRKGSSAALAAAFKTARRVEGKAGSTYLIDQAVTLPPDAEFVGNGAIIKLVPGSIGFRLANPRCKLTNWIIEGNGALYAVLATSDRSEFSDNICRGDIGHFLFSTGGTNVSALRNRIEGGTAASEITTALLAEDTNGVTFSNNHFRDIMTGWAMSVRGGTENVVISGNDCRQTQWSDSIVATAGQRIFRFVLGSRVHLKRIQINGSPRSTGYTITGAGPEYAVTFSVGRKAGEVVKLVGYRGAENIQVNTGCKSISITGNYVDGTGDSGILILSPHSTVADNIVKNCGFAGIAIYAGADHATVTGNHVSDCAQMDDALSSPDFPLLSSVFAGGILISSQDVTVTGNTIENNSGTMRYGIRVNKSDMALRTDGGAAITLARNSFKGSFVDGEIFAINDTSGQRINSVVVDGPVVTYPSAIDIDQPWTNAPPSSRHFAYGGFGRSYSVRDAMVRRSGQASIRTVAGEYLDIEPREAAKLRNCVVEISFWAKNGSGESYFTVFTELRGLPFPLTATITDKSWRPYKIRFMFTDNLGPKMLLRAGAKTGFANIQNIEIVGRRL
jgi:hypothetical protein